MFAYNDLEHFHYQTEQSDSFVIFFTGMLYPNHNRCQPTHIRHHTSRVVSVVESNSHSSLLSIPTSVSYRKIAIKPRYVNVANCRTSLRYLELGRPANRRSAAPQPLMNNPSPARCCHFFRRSKGCDQVE